MRSVPVLCAAVLACVCVASSSAAVRKISFTSSVSPGDEAALSVAVSPRARCTIKVVYDTTVSHALGLGAKTGSKITWRWKVGSSTHAGSWPVTVDCGKSGRLVLRLRVH
jgi:hypothetical protein